MRESFQNSVCSQASTSSWPCRHLPFWPFPSSPPIPPYPPSASPACSLPVVLLQEAWRAYWDDASAYWAVRSAGVGDVRTEGGRCRGMGTVPSNSG